MIQTRVILSATLIEFKTENSGPAEAVQSWSGNNIGSCVEGGSSLGGSAGNFEI